MMFLPWLDEQELENKDPFKIYEKNEIIITEYRRRFESVIMADYEIAQEQVRREIQKVYENN